MRKHLQFILFLSMCNVVKAQTWQDTVSLIDKIFIRYSDTIPGAQLAISRNGDLIYSSARGMADLEHYVPLTKQSKIEAGSVSKQFTAAATLLLAQQGKISLDDDIRKYLPEVPDYGHKITIRHLIHHTSGLKDWGAIGAMAGWPRTTKAYTNADALEIVSRQKTLNNIPGDEFIYSNSNYNLQATIIERVSGLSLADFSKKYIFEPAGMSNTEWRDDYQRVVRNRAIAYSKSRNIYFTNMPNENAYGNGGLLTTAEDLLKWNNYYLSGKLGNPSLFQNQIALKTLNDGKKNVYASGLFIDSLNGWSVIRHDGATAGYRSNLEYFPQLGISIAWLSNNSQPDLGNTSSLIRNLLIKNIRPSIVTQNSPKVFDLKSFAPFIGTYLNSKTRVSRKAYIKDSAIFLDQFKLVPVSANRFAIGGATVIFTEKPKRFQFMFNGITDDYHSVDTAQITANNINDYTGLYYSNETESKIKVFVKDGKIMTKLRQESSQLTPVYKDGFSNFSIQVFFTRDKQGRINKMFLSSERARNVEFVKQDGKK